MNQIRCPYCGRKLEESMFGLWTKEKFTPIEVSDWSVKDNYSFSSICTTVLSKLAAFFSQFRLASRKPVWVEGTINEYSYCLKVYRESSNMGINGGRISKLEIWKNGSLVVNYDRGWDKKPSTGELLNLVNELIQKTDRKHITRRVSKGC